MDNDKARGRSQKYGSPSRRAQITSIGQNVARALRRPGAYPGFARELMWAGVNFVTYPAGVLSEALKIEQAVSLGDRFNKGVAFNYLDPEASSTPIVLLHGAFHNRSAFLVMKRALRRHGFRHIDRMNYNVIGHDIEELAQQLHDHLFEVLYVTGATRVHLIGHSLGGLVARYFIQELGGHEKVHTCITLGTPHQGTYAAVVGRMARQVRPGSELIARLREGAQQTPVRFISYYSNLDPVVLPASNAKIVEPALRAQNILARDHGHMSLIVSRPVIRSITRSLSSLDEPRAFTKAADQTAGRPLAAGEETGASREASGL